MIRCVVCNPALDVTYEVPGFEAGRTYAGVATTSDPAGKGINVAKVIRALGEEVGILGFMPENALPRVGRYLESCGISCGFLSVPGDVRMNATITDRNGSTTHISGTGPEYAAVTGRRFAAFLDSEMRPNEWWALSGSLPNGFEPGFYGTLVRSCRKKDIPCLLDTRDAPLSFGVRARPAIVKPNIAELEGLFCEEIQGVRFLALKGKRLLDGGIDYVFITAGSDGMIALHDSDCLLCTPPESGVVDTTGCGDAVAAGILVGRVRQYSFTEMCRLGVACGVSNALHRGAGNIDSDQVWSLMEDVRIEGI